MAPYRDHVALEHAILVSLAERAASGYDLTRRFERSIGFFWRATHQQIYRTLARMEGEGWVAAVAVPQEGRPDRKEYGVTSAGSEELRRWLTEPSRVVPLREELAVRLRGADHLEDLTPLLDDLRRHRAEHAARVRLYTDIEARDFSPDLDHGPLSGRRLHQHLVLRGGLRVEQAFVDWCDEVLTSLTGDLP